MFRDESGSRRFVAEVVVEECSKWHRSARKWACNLTIAQKRPAIAEERRRSFGFQKKRRLVGNLKGKQLQIERYDCGLWDVDACDLAGSRRGCAEVRHVKLPIRAKGHGRRNDETNSDVFDITVGLTRTTLPSPGVG
jgi:hypothetical protein